MIGRWIFLRDGRVGGRAKLVLALVFLIALVVLLPLRLVLGAAGGPALSAGGAEGPVWSGRIGDLQIGPLPIGTVDAGVRPLPLLLGRGELWLSRGGTAPFSAVVGGDSDSVRLSRVTGSLVLGDALGALPVSALGFSDFSYSTEGGQCVAADGTVSLTLSSLSPLMPADLVLSGRARCDHGALYVPMAGQSGMEHLMLRIAADGTWKADLVVAGLPAEASGPLLQQGFSARPGGIGVSVSGRF